MKARLAVSMGDPAGIGAEVLLRAAAAKRVARACRVTVFGDRSIIEALASRLDIPAPGSAGSAVAEVVEVTRLGRSGGRLLPRPSRRSGQAAFDYLARAARVVLDGGFDALVTAPINKMWMSRAGHDYDGHTEYLSELTGRRATMMLAGQQLRVVPVTTHMAHADVAGALSKEAIIEATRATVAHLRDYQGMAKPRVAVAALNPHAGEGGMFGSEEAELIAPAVTALRRARLDVTGPLAADTLFAAAKGGHYDAVVCMYHDQALIPLKLLDFGQAVNVSMGLPLIRTSPDHGTAYDLAGSGKADPGSMTEALIMAAAMAGKAAARRRK
jgi:4-hydroxythreonine-4-phosphate dehydrogenase